VQIITEPTVKSPDVVAGPQVLLHIEGVDVLRVAVGLQPSQLVEGAAQARH